jgi:uncharacterized membrane protein
MELRTIGARLDHEARLDAPSRTLRSVADAALPEGAARDALQGRWLGHSVHPLMTDLPIGFWTSAFVLDLVGGKKRRAAADRLVGLGIVSAVPTVVTGLAELPKLDARKQRSAVVHVAANSVATVLYTMSWRARRRGERYRGVALGLLAATAATAGGFLGGHLAFGDSDEPIRDEREPELWDVVSLEDAASSADGAPTPARSGLVDGRI